MESWNSLHPDGFHRESIETAWGPWMCLHQVIGASWYDRIDLITSNLADATWYLYI